MADGSAEPAWDPHLVWPDGIPEPSSSLLDMLHEPDRLMPLGATDGGEASAPAGDEACTSGEGRRTAAKRDSLALDDGWDAELPCKAHAGAKSDPQAAKVKASREKQRREQLKNRCGDPTLRSIHRTALSV